MSDDIRVAAQAEISGTAVARMIIDFHREMRSVYGADVMTSNLCAVGPLQSMIGLAIKNGLLSPPPNHNNGGRGMTDITAKFTPGPWDVDGREIIGRKGRKVITDYGSYEGLAWGGGNVTEAETEANKALIAASPDLYTALAEAVEQLEFWGGDTTNANKVLAQARGVRN